MDRFPYLRGLGISSLENISETLVNISNNLTPSSLVNGLILELSELIQPQDSYHSKIGQNQISKRQFCEFVLKVACGRNSDAITAKDVSNYGDKRNFLSLRKRIEKGDILESNIWKAIIKLLPPAHQHPSTITTDKERSKESICNIQTETDYSTEMKEVNLKPDERILEVNCCIVYCFCWLSKKFHKGEI